MIDSPYSTVNQRKWLACSLLIFTFAVPAAGQTASWNTHVSPSQVGLECVDERTFTETQTRREIAQRYAIVGHIQEISRKIREMDNAGWEVNGSGENQSVSVRLPVYFTYKRDILFSAKANSREVTLKMRRMAGTPQVRMDQEKAQYLTDTKKEEIDRKFRNWYREVKQELATERNKLNGKVYSLSVGERQDISGYRTGSIEDRHATFNVCNDSESLRISASWHH